MIAIDVTEAFPRLRRRRGTLSPPSLRLFHWQSWYMKQARNPQELIA
jgi:hypothetical protein